MAEFHSWSSLLDYGLLFRDILQHNFHFYINDSFLSKLTILTSFSQKKKKTNKQTIKLDQQGGGDLLFVTYIIRENTMQRKKCWDGFPSDPPFLNSPFTMSTTLVNFTIHKFFGDKFPKEQRNGAWCIFKRKQFLEKLHSSRKASMVIMQQFKTGQVRRTELSFNDFRYMKFIYLHCSEETNLRDLRSYEHFWTSSWK